MTALPPLPLSGTGTKPRSDSASSRNDLFNTSWAPEVPPPKPLSLSLAVPGVGIAGPSTFPRSAARKERDVVGISEFGLATSTAQAQAEQEGGIGSGSTTTQRASRTSSFFDTASDLPSPAPAPAPSSRGPPSPLNLSRSSSLRNRPPPIPLDFSTTKGRPPNLSAHHPRTPPIDSEPLSPLHQSPSLPPIGDWIPPQPPSSDDVTLRLNPRSAFLLGEGRYATVFLGSYKKESTAGDKGNGKNDNPFKAYGNPRITRTPPDEDAQDPLAAATAAAATAGEVNERGDGYVGGSWRLCAAKRMAPDRQSQTMGLREAFFLNRLSTTANGDTATLSLLGSVNVGRIGKGSSSRRAISPLRDGLSRMRSSPPRTPANGSVYVVKLIAVKEDGPTRTPLHSTTAANTNPVISGHGRSASDAVVDNPKGLVRQRSSTMMNRTRDAVPDDSPMTSLNSFPSLPSLAQAAKAETQAAPALTRLVLVLEHAPLGTMDRFLRTSPGLVGKALWQRWAIQTTEALQWVHGKGIVHADIKAGNLLLTADLDVRLSDFGSSLLIHPSHPPTDGVGLGTLPFSPPELVDPERSFSFPVDIFSLGATLYQCITGREPFRGCRTVEMMHHVRKGGLWVWEERERLSRIGQEREDSVAPSPYPSAWRAGDYAQGGVGASGVKRAGSLRVPMSTAKVIHAERPKLGRMSSTESLRASEDAGHTDSPPGVKLWGRWIGKAATGGGGGGGSGSDPVSLLLAEKEDHTVPSSASRLAATSLRVDTASSRASPSTSNASSPTSPVMPDTASAGPTREPIGTAYDDGSPAMFYLDNRERVDEGVRQVLQAMLQAREESRPTAEQLRAKWEELGVVSDGEA